MDTLTNGDGGVRREAARAHGMRLHYRTGGTGKAVVLLHGFPQASHEWRRIMPALAARFTVVARGLGDSDRPVGGYDKRTAEDVSSLVKGLGFERSAASARSSPAPRLGAIRVTV